MVPGQTILTFLILLIASKAVFSECVVRDRFIGVDSGNLVIASFSYDLTVKDGTNQTVIQKAVLPAIEKSLAEQSAPLLIPGCAQAETDTSQYLDIVGIDLDPTDAIAGRCAKKPNCYTIKCKTSIYVKSSSIGVVASYLSVTASLLRNMTTGTSADQVIVSLDNFKIATDPSTVTPQNGALNNTLFYGIFIGSILCCWAIPCVCIWWCCCSG